MSKANQHLVDLLIKPLKKIPNAVLFHADEATLKEYVNALADAKVEKKVTFNDYCRAKIIALQPYFKDFQSAFNYFKSEQKEIDYEGSFEDFLAAKGIQPKELLTDLYYLVARYKEAHAKARQEEEIRAYTLSEPEIQSLVNDYVAAHLPRRTIFSDFLLRAVGSEASGVDEFRRKVVIEHLPRLIKEYKVKRANEIYDSIHSSSDNILETRYLEELTSVKPNTILVASLADLELGAKYEDARIDAGRLHPREMTYGDNYRQVDSGYSLQGANLSGTIIKNSHFSQIDLSQTLFRDVSFENVKMDDCNLCEADLRGADTTRLAVNYAFRSDFILPKDQTREEYIRENFRKVLVSSYNTYVLNRTFLSKDLESGAISEDDITPTNQRMSGRSTREFEIFDGSSDYDPTISYAFDEAFIFDPTYKRQSDEKPKTKHLATAQDLKDFLELTESKEYEQDFSFNQYINNIYAKPGETLYASLEGIDLRSFTNKLAGLNLSYVDFHNCDLRSMNLSGTKFRGSNLENAKFEGANLSESDLSYSNAISTDFHNCRFGKGASLVGATLDLANFKEAEVNASDLTDCLGRYMNADGLKANKIIATRANLQGISAINAMCIEGNFVEATLSGANLTEAIMESAVMEDVVADKLIAVNTKFSDACMDRLRAREADFSNAVMQKVKMREADISGSILKEANFKEADLTGAFAQDIIAIKAEFEQAILNEIDLKFSNLERAVMHHIEAQNADLRNVVMKHVQATRANFTKSLMQGADASFAELKESILKEANLQYSRFREATLENAELKLAKAQGTDFGSANMTGIKATGIEIDDHTNLREAKLTNATDADHLKELQSRQQDTLISRIFRTAKKQMLLGAIIFAGLYLMPCLALGAGVSVIKLAGITALGTLSGIAAKPIWGITKFLQSGDTWMNSAQEKLAQTGNKLLGASLQVFQLFFGTASRVDHQELAGESHLKQIGQALQAKHLESKTSEKQPTTPSYTSGLSFADREKRPDSERGLNYSTRKQLRTAQLQNSPERGY